MRKALVVIGIGALVWWWVVLRGRPAEESVVIGYVDGSSLDVPPRTPAWREALGLAREALRA